MIGEKHLHALTHKGSADIHKEVVARQESRTQGGCHPLPLLPHGSTTSDDRAAELAWLRVSVSQAPKNNDEGSAGACAPASPAPAVALVPPLAKIRVSPVGGGAGP